MTDRTVTVKHVEPVFRDGRGEIMDLLEGETILHVGLITSRAGAIRGNHYHNKAKQFNYVLSGRMELITRDVDAPSAKPQRSMLKKGDFVAIPTRVVHALKALEDSEFIDLNTESRAANGYEEDTVRVVIEK